MFVNDEPQYSRGVVIAGSTWLVAATLLVVAWASWFLGAPEHVHLAVLLGQTAGVAACVAVVLHVRCYAARTCRLIRVANGLQRPRDAEVRDFTPRDR